jgi:hypothetical protein
MTDPVQNQPAFPTWSEVLGVNLRRWGWFLLGAFLLAGLGKMGWGHYRKWTVDRLAAKAETLYRQNQWREAVLVARETLQQDPKNLVAERIMARIAQRNHPQAALVWLRRLAERDPGNTDLWLDLAASALRAQELTVVEASLARIGPAGRRTARYHELAGAWSLAGGHVVQAEEHFRQAAQQGTNQLASRFNLASLALRRDDSGTLQQGRHDMELMAAEPAYAALALRCLVDDARRAENPARREQFLRRLATLPNAGMADRLPWLEWQKTRHPQAYSQTLADYQFQSRTNVQAAALLADWMRSNGQAELAAGWIKTLPEEIRTASAITIALADCLVQTKQWESLADLAKPGRKADWLSMESVQYAYQSRALRGLDQRTEANNTWTSARTEAGTDTFRLALLARLAGRWDWTFEAEAIWRELAYDPGVRMTALAELLRLYYAEGREKSLLQVATTLYEWNPRELSTANNYAYLRLLLRVQTEEAAQMARDNLTRDPQSPSLILACAFGEAQLGRKAAALDCLKQLRNPAQLRGPDLACYGWILYTTGQTNQARPFLEKTVTSPGLLPTERELIEEALRSLNRR